MIEPGPAVKRLVGIIANTGAYTSDQEKAANMLVRMARGLTQDEFEYVEQRLTRLMFSSSAYSSQKRLAEKTIIAIRERRHT